MPEPRSAAGGGRPTPASARAMALEILGRVESSQAFANLLLDDRLAGSGLSDPDRALATHLVYGILRWRGKLDWALQQVLDRPLRALEPAVRRLLWLGAYQLLCLDRIPPFAAVSETVALARSGGNQRSAAFVNAVLRAVARRRPFPEPDAAADPLAYWESVGSHPRWLAARWLARLGEAEASALMAANNQAPALTVLVNLLRADPGGVRDRLVGALPAVIPGRLTPLAFSLPGCGSPGELPGFAEGHLIPMDEAAILPVQALDLSPGQTVLDACAGGGGKSALIAAGVGPAGRVLAVDTSPRAIRRLRGGLERLGIETVQAEQADAGELGGRFPGAFSRVLLDAPCTGLGTLRRRPEIKWRRRPDDLPRAARLQAALLAAVAPAVAPGGLLVYSTCSLEPEETDAVIEQFLTAQPAFRMAEGAPGGAGSALSRAADPEAAGVFRAWPHRHGTDGFFVARLVRAC